jgi:hypothetical protein
MKDIVEHNIEQMNIEQLNNFVSYLHKNKYNKQNVEKASRDALHQDNIRQG